MKPEDKVDLLLFDDKVECHDCKAEFKPKKVTYLKQRYMGMLVKRIICPECRCAFYEVA